MSTTKQNQPSRRHFIGALATGAATLSLSSLSPLTAGAKHLSDQLPSDDDPDAWFKQIKGKHRIVFDVTTAKGMLPFAWSRVFLLTNASTGTPEKDNSVVVVLRHEAIPYAMQNNLWEQYKFGDVFNVKDEGTGTAAVRNAFWQPKAGDFKIPGVGEVAIGINQLQESGVMFCVCNMALTVYSAALAEKVGKTPAEVKKDWMAGILPGIQVVPSGVWAVGRAQEHNCAYCFAG